MSEEIKEILYLQNYVEKYKSDEKAIIKGNRLTTPAMLDYLEVKALLDYITNLQQKVEQLEKENKILKEDNVFLKNNLSKLSKKYIKNDLLNILNKGSDKE